MSITTDDVTHALPRHVAVIGAAGGLGTAVLDVCRKENIGFTAVVRSRPERITDVPSGSRIAVVRSLADRDTLDRAFAGADAVLSVVGTTATSMDANAMLSRNMAVVEDAMQNANVERIILMNTMIAAPPGKPMTRLMRFFSWMPGAIGRGAAEQQAVIDALGAGSFSSLRWTLVRAGVNRRGADEPPVASRDWPGAQNSWAPVSYRAMARWIIDESAADRFVCEAPLVSRRRR